MFWSHSVLSSRRTPASSWSPFKVTDAADADDAQWFLCVSLLTVPTVPNHPKQLHSAKSSQCHPISTTLQNHLGILYHPMFLMAALQFGPDISRSTCGNASGFAPALQSRSVCPDGNGRNVNWRNAATRMIPVRPIPPNSSNQNIWSFTGKRNKTFNKNMKPKEATHKQQIRRKSSTQTRNIKKPFQTPLFSAVFTSPRPAGDSHWASPHTSEQHAYGVAR